MPTVATICDFLERFAPVASAEEWDNVGLLIGDRIRTASRVMTCLTVTPTTVAEAVEQNVDLIVAHHPLPFRPIRRLTTDRVEGRLLWQLIGAEICLYSPHTAFDSAETGINQRLAEGLGMREIEPLITRPGGTTAGRQGQLDPPMSLEQFAGRAKQFLQVEQLQLVGPRDSQVRRVAVACGSAGEMLDAAREQGCDVLVTGETNFHTCLAAEAQQISLVLPGHYASERFAVEFLAEELARELPDTQIWASRLERDPLSWC